MHVNKIFLHLRQAIGRQEAMVGGKEGRMANGGGEGVGGSGLIR